MKQALVQSRTSALVSILDQLIPLQETLHVAVRNKLEAMRQSDADAMIRAAHHEGEVAGRISVLNEQRRQAVSDLCAAIGFDQPIDLDSLTLSTLLARMDGPEKDTLRERGQVLRQAMLQVAEANRIADLVCREMLEHFKNLFEVLKRDDDDPTTYSRGGAVEAADAAKVLDATG